MGDAERSTAPLGIIAGGGQLPGEVAAAARAIGRPVFVLGLDGHANPSVLAPFPHAIVRLGAVKTMRALLHEHNCRDLVLVGAVRRPSLLHLRPDAEAVRVLARIGRAKFAGDDGLLATIIGLLGEAGFRVLGAHEILGEALAAAGVATILRPDEQAMSDIARGMAVARALGSVDVGQGCVVQQGLVLAVETIEGTDAMLARAGPLRREGIGGVLVKCSKPGQDHRTDLPTVGPVTVRLAAAAGLRGIAYEAAASLLVDRAAAIAAADEARLFLYGLDATKEFP